MSLLSPSLEAFWAVVQKGTVLEAAKMVNLTQTGVTQRIRSLEKQLGVTLFTRSRKGMRLTNEGESLLRYVKAARDLEGETLSSIGGKKQNTYFEVCISGPSTLMRSRMIPRAAAVMKKYPNLRVRFDITDTDNIIGKLKTGFTQIGALPVNQVGLELDSKIVMPERYYLVGPSAWKKRRIEDIVTNETIIDFDPQNSRTLDLLKKYKITKFSKHRHFANNIDALTSLIIDGAGYSALTEEFARPFIKEGSLTYLKQDMFLDSPLTLAWYPRSEMPPYFKALIDAFTKRS
ncbi:MAG: LysR family transcriptional regulator [Bdellovibrio sp. ArHS]|uniref:LysR family transcriptional regulator n=1 Tax=Bdellovibrio sp. ArHS TaxID=1569284 RepID=UPI00058392A4|nr:LysR family transcriptional regulator [Bdellovibrio sp. ArHS]KHD88107.1 MAG: LysR family transcriptional regulator [Bdellovibrio sp. ArHS]